MITLPSNLRTKLEDCEKRCFAIASKFIEGMNNSELPPIVYHYTEDKGLRGILDSGVLWFTAVANLNDPTEMQHGLPDALKIIRAKKPSNGPQDANLLFATRLEELLIDSDFSNVAQYFVCCFSKSADDLRQWRAYADDGRGFALGFETGALLDGFMKTELTGSHNSTFPLTYDDAKIHKMHEEAINNVFRFLPRLAGLDLNNDGIDYIIRKLCEDVWTQCLLLSI